MKTQLLRSSMRNVALFGSLGVGLLFAVAGCEPVDDGASSRAKGWDPVKDGLSDNVLDGDRGVFIDIDETTPVADGCAKTVMDAHKILQDNCASCHDQGPASMGVPVFDFVMNDDQLKTRMWTRATGPAINFVSVGKPDESAIFIRAAIDRNMPPLATEIGQAEAPRITFSGVSVLRQWIEKCM
jgi:hypothetical protein